MESYNCPNCGAPIGYQDRCEYCGTRIEWRPYEIHLAPRLCYCKTHCASAIGKVEKRTDPLLMEIAKRELFERLSSQLRGNVNVVQEDCGDAVFLRADIFYADKNEVEGK